MQRTRAERGLAGLGRRHDPRIQRGGLIDQFCAYPVARSRFVTCDPDS
jgi:hypothetical protein